MLQKGRLKGFCGVEVGLAFAMKNLSNDSVSLSKFHLEDRDVYMIFSPSFSAAEFEIINKATQELLKENVLTSILNKYRSSPDVLSSLNCEKESEVRWLGRSRPSVCAKAPAPIKQHN